MVFPHMTSHDIYNQNICLLRHFSGRTCRQHMVNSHEIGEDRLFRGLVNDHCWSDAWLHDFQIAAA